MTKDIRVRFAPSPTGPLHIGGLRTALFNYLFAKKLGGAFILRIEDTDQNRYVEGTEAYIVEALNWCGIPFDEGPASAPLSGQPLNQNEADFSNSSQIDKYGPYRQSERKHLYKAYADELIKTQKAYYAFDTTEQLDFHRKDHEAKGKNFIYNWHNRSKLDNSLNLSPAQVQQKLDSGKPYVVRFLSPVDRKLVMTDRIRGSIEIDTNTLDDKVLFKSDGMPTYHLANIVDDHLMEISHVIRGEEWLPSLALHLLLYEAFGWEAPEFAHLPLIMKPVGKGKLSKRDGEKGGFPVFPLSWKEAQGYREAGYFPEAVVNFLALLGWNPGTEQELFSLKDLIQTFDLNRVNNSGARFDPEKTKWYNHHYLQQKTDAQLAEMFVPYLNEHLGSVETPSFSYVEKVVSLIKERADFVVDLWGLGSYFFKAPTTYDPKAVKKQWKEDTPHILGQLMSELEKLNNFSPENLENQTKAWIGKQELSFGKVMPPLRLVIVGDMKGPHLFDIMGLIGKTETLGRIRKAIALL
ncbi:MAG: glutamate--tRNA ligase [Bacteroidota bacterium]